MFGLNFKIKNFHNKNIKIPLKKKLKEILSEKNQILESLSKNYKYNFNKRKLSRYRKFKNVRIIGMGGSTLGTQAIYDFLNYKIKKKFYFLDNINTSKYKKKEKKYLNLIVSKSGNTIETIFNANIFIKKNDENIFITENKKTYLFDLAQKLKSEIIHHNNFIGGRYSVLSEVGMLPAELMGLKTNDFKQYNNLIKNKFFLNTLITNVQSTLNYIKNKKYNSIIINYDKNSQNLFYWYQQLIAESLGKNSKGLLPIVSLMPKDNHSVMQLYLDGFKNNFYTIFYVNEKKSLKVNNKTILNSGKFLKNQDLDKIIYAQKRATENIFLKKNIPFRSIEIYKRNETTLGELFCFFVLETILIAKVLNLNPYDQPAVELIKKETKKLLT
tara:strand:+ start:619 stop:1773 length:1155 start_codon:yes stop_codon:yes gene_type:complete